MPSPLCRTRLIALAGLGVTAALPLLFAATSAQATSVLFTTLEEKVVLSHLVVRGTTERVQATWEAEGQSVHTLITFRVDEVVKGKAKVGQRITIRQSGGVVGSFDHRVPGVSRWQDGEQAIMFLQQVGARWTELGIGIGKYPVDIRQGKSWVSHNPDVSLVRPREGKPPEIFHSSAMQPELLTTFMKRIRSYTKGVTAPTRTTKDIRRAKPTVVKPR